MMLRVENLESLYSKIYTVETGFAAEVSIYPSLEMSLYLITIILKESSLAVSSFTSTRLQQTEYFASV